MTHRPYPDADRARHQIERHDDETPPYSEPRPLTPFEQKLAEGAQAALLRVAPIAAGLRAAFQPRPAGGGSLTVARPADAQVFKARPWTAEEYQRWERTGFPPGSGWEPPQDDTAPERPAGSEETTG
jgi:hypothetical protein